MLIRKNIIALFLFLASSKSVWKMEIQTILKAFGHVFKLNKNHRHGPSKGILFDCIFTYFVASPCQPVRSNKLTI